MWPGLCHHACNSRDIALGNLGHIGRPLLPIAAVADLLHHLGKNGILQLAKLQRHLLLNLGTRRIRRLLGLARARCVCRAILRL